tara:strand:- start:171 stop:980 length:810 start_codon:yes stop_codon:yes gene_type:complete
MHNLTGVYWIKDEGPYLEEYIEFHLLQGFDHFIFYDNGSTDNTFEVLNPYIAKGLVELRKYPEEVTKRKNFWVMATCIKEQRGKSKWIHFHAIDERLYSPTGKQLPDLLENYESYAGVCVGWLLVTNNGHETKPDGLIIENYTKVIDDEQKHIKTIIQPDKTREIYPLNPHNFFYIGDNYAVDENFNKIDGPFNTANPYTLNIFKNYHYVTMSREEFECKMNKGVLDHNDSEHYRRPDADIRWSRVNNKPHLEREDLDLLQFVDEIKSK